MKLEREARAATALVTHHDKIANEFLKEAGVKLSHRKQSYSTSIHRRESYEKGRVDSKEIDMDQRSLAGPKGRGKAR